MGRAMGEGGGAPRVLSMRERAEVGERVLRKRLETILPRAMRESGIDMWLVICQEDDLDPVYPTLIPLDTWCPILQILVFFDRGEEAGIERINLSMTDTHDLYDRPWSGREEAEQWALLRSIVAERDPRRIGIDIGGVQWAAGGLTHNLYRKLVATLDDAYAERLVSAEPLVTRWLATLSEEEIDLHAHVVDVGLHILGRCYTRAAITPGLTATKDLEWFYRERCAERGIDVSFKPSFYVIRSDEAKRRFGEEDRVIRPGDFIRCDVGIRYLGLHSDHQRWAYIARGEGDAPPAFARDLMAQGNRLQDIFMAEFRRGLTGNELLANILTRARREGLPNPKVYSHSLGRFLHQPGPLIGLPWEQERCPGRGDVRLEYDYAFTMELSVRDAIPAWGEGEFLMALEEDVVFTREGCRFIGSRQREFRIV
ncbi:MAG: M24 family metallopeptidase [Planctomycetes bacterium]|nr:M24 family metallopeptidase [Planctomycetota bacterium]